MKIQFSAFGLAFTADVDPVYSSFYEGEDYDLEYKSLTCGGRDASFLLDSDLWYDIEDRVKDKIDSEEMARARENKGNPDY